MFGGTFNPPHNGHVTMARAAVNQLGLDKLLIVPDCVPPHKPLPSGVTARQRYDMAAQISSSTRRKAAMCANSQMTSGSCHVWRDRNMSDPISSHSSASGYC